MKLLFLNQGLKVEIWDVFIKQEIMNMIFTWNQIIAQILIPSGSILEFKIPERTGPILFILKIYKSLIPFTIWECFLSFIQEKRLKELEMDGIEMEIMFVITKTHRKRKTKKAKTIFTAYHLIFDSDTTSMKFTLLIVILILILI